MASSIDDEIRTMDTWPSLKAQLPYSHAPCYTQLPELEMVAVCDVIEEKCLRFRERWDVPRHYVDYRQMIRDERPDILSIATPASQHAEIACFAMENGVKGIYCEKAMCCSLREADAIVESAQRHDVKFMLGAQRRHHPIFRKARELITSGRLGTLLGVTSWINGSLLHSLSHAADNALFLAGDAAPVSAFGVLAAVWSPDEVENRRIATNAAFNPESRRWDGDPGCLTWTVRLETGVLLTHLPAMMDFKFEAECSNGYLRILDNCDTLRVYGRRGRTYSFDPVDIEPPAPASSHLQLVRDLVDRVKNGGRTLANETVGRHGLEMLMGVAESHLRGGQTVPLPLTDRAMYIPSH